MPSCRRGVTLLGCLVATAVTTVGVVTPAIAQAAAATAAPTSSTLSVSATHLAYGRTATVTGRLRSAGQPVKGQSATLESHRAGGAWRPTGKVLSTSSSGVAAWQVAPSVVTTYRVVFAASADYAASTTASRTVTVSPLLAVTAPKTARIGISRTIRGTERPSNAGGTAQLQRRTHHRWSVVESRSVRGGAFALPFTSGAPGHTRYRVYRPATASRGAAASRPFVVSASGRTLRSGSSGQDVRWLQRRLKHLHYDVGAVNGRFGYDMLHAVTAFQKEQGLTRDGAVGASVWKKQAKPRRPHLKHPYKKQAHAIEVDLTRQVVYYEVHGKINRIIDASTAGGYMYRGSDGAMHRAVTPTGHFHIVYKVDHWVTAPLGTLYRPAYFNNDGYAIHGEGSVPPYPASHGCVRVTVPAMDRLYNKLPVGTSVWIYRS